MDASQHLYDFSTLPGCRNYLAMLKFTSASMAAPSSMPNGNIYDLPFRIMPNYSTSAAALDLGIPIFDPCTSSATFPAPTSLTTYLDSAPPVLPDNITLTFGNQCQLWKCVSGAMVLEAVDTIAITKEEDKVFFKYLGKETLDFWGGRSQLQEVVHKLDMG